MHLAATGLSFRQISKAVAVFRTHASPLLSDLVTNSTPGASRKHRKKPSLATPKAQLTFSEEQTAELLRLGMAASIGATSALLETCWAFGLELRTTSQRTPLPYLDVRVKLYSKVDAAVLSVHLLAIPTWLDKCDVFMFQALDRALSAVQPNWRKKLLGIATSGDSPISPRTELVLARLRRELEGPVLYRSWRSGDQLRRILGSFYASIHGGGFLRALEPLRECIRLHPELLAGLHDAPPSLQDATEWLALGGETSWMVDHLDVLWERLEKQRLELYRPAESWVLALVVVSWVDSRATDAFTTLLHPRATGAQQAQAVAELAKDFGALFKAPDRVNGSTAALGNAVDGRVRPQTERLATGKHNFLTFVTNVSAFASRVAKRMAPATVDRVVDELLLAMVAMIEELSKLNSSLRNKDDHDASYATAAKLTRTLPPVLPHELVQLSPSEFAELFQTRGLLPPQELQLIQSEHSALRRAVACEMPLQTVLARCHESTPFHEAWSALDGRFKRLEAFAGGLACVLPCAFIVEGAAECTGLALSAPEKGRDLALCTDFVLEAALHAQQFQALTALQAKGSRRG